MFDAERQVCQMPVYRCDKAKAVQVLIAVANKILSSVDLASDERSKERSKVAYAGRTKVCAEMGIPLSKNWTRKSRKGLLHQLKHQHVQRQTS